MNDQAKTKQQLIDELSEMRGKVSDLEAHLASLEGKVASLLENEKVLRSLYENAPLPYQSLDENGHILAVNRAWLDTLGYAVRTLTANGLAIFWLPMKSRVSEIISPVSKPWDGLVELSMR